MRTGGIDEAVRAAGGIGALARSLGISQPAVSSWHRVPAERVLAVEAVTGIARSRLRPDLYPAAMTDARPNGAIDEYDALRSQEYGLLAVVLGRAPTAALLEQLGRLGSDESPLGRAHGALAAAARTTDPDEVSREYFDLFIGIGRGELLPYASYYLTGFLNERPLARVRHDLAAIGLERSDSMSEPEDHIAILFDTMAALAGRRLAVEPRTDARFFERHIEPWAGRLFADLENAESARFYRHVGALGRLWVEIETEAFALDA